MNAQSLSSFLGDCKISTLSPMELTDKFYEFRDSVYVCEKGFLSREMASKYDQFGVYIVLTLNGDDTPIAAIQTYKAEVGEFADMSELPVDRLKSGIVLTRLMVRKEYRGFGLSGLMLYMAMQQGRRWKRSRAFLYVEQGEMSTRRHLSYEVIPSLPTFIPTGAQKNKVIPCTQFLEMSMAQCFSQMTPEVKDFLRPYLGQEAVDTVNERLDKFFKNPWFKAVYSETMTKHQYIQTLGNLYQFVRLTTRILSRAVSLCDDSGMRNHFLEHLNGEIDHEIQIESDLAQVDSTVVDFVKNRMIPSIPTQQFMVIQESLLAYNHDPLSYVAVPFSIEGFTARLDQKFIQCLENCLKKWGVQRPARGVTFFRVHINSDGGEDGHWESNKKFLKKYIDTDLRLKKFINVIHLTMDSLENCYSSYVAEPDFTQISVPLTEFPFIATAALSPEHLSQ